MEVKDRVIDIVAKQVGLPVYGVKVEDNLQTDLGADSIDIAEISLSIQEEFGIVVDHMESLSTVGDFINLIEKRRKGF